MPRTPIDYSKSVIYKIQHLEKDELVYVGSTTNFNNRKNKHKSYCKTRTQKVYEMICENGGWECFNMIIIKEYPCQTRTELLQEEDRVMRELNSSLNMVRAYTDRKQYEKEYREKNKEIKKENYQKNKEEIIKKAKENYEKNKEKRKIQMKEYDLKRNKEEKNKKAREAYQKKKNNAIDLKK